MKNKMVWLALALAVVLVSLAVYLVAFAAVVNAGVTPMVTF